MPTSITDAIHKAQGYLKGIERTPCGYAVRFFDPEAQAYISHHVGDGKTAQIIACELVLVTALESLTGLSEAELRQRIDLEAIRKTVAQSQKRVRLALELLGHQVPPPQKGATWRRIY